jgi:hypothetical protein
LGDKEIDFKALVPLDGQEMQIIFDTCIDKAKELNEQGKPFEAGVYTMIAIKMRNKKKEFHGQHFQRFNKIYGFTKEKSQL